MNEREGGEGIEFQHIQHHQQQWQYPYEMILQLTKSDNAAAAKACDDTCPNNAESVVFIPTHDNILKKMGIPSTTVSYASCNIVGCLSSFTAALSVDVAAAPVLGSNGCSSPDWVGFGVDDMLVVVSIVRIVWGILLREESKRKKCVRVCYISSAINVSLSLEMELTKTKILSLSFALQISNIYTQSTSNLEYSM